MELLILGLAGWRYAFFVTDDSLAQPTKEKLLGKFAGYAGKHKKLVGLSEKLDELTDCIYCLTFWSSLFLLLISNFQAGKWFITLGAIWATATLIGVIHNVIADLISDEDKVE